MSGGRSKEQAHGAIRYRGRQPVPPLRALMVLPVAQQGPEAEHRPGYSSKEKSKRN